MAKTFPCVNQHIEMSLCSGAFKRSDGRTLRCLALHSLVCQEGFSVTCNTFDLGRSLSLSLSLQRTQNVLSDGVVAQYVACDRPVA